MSAILALILLILPPCPAEDSRNCYWDGEARGNGVGISFIDIGGNLFETGGLTGPGPRP